MTTNGDLLVDIIIHKDTWRVGEPVPGGDVMVNIVFPRDRQERWVPPNTHTGKIIVYEKKAHLQKS